MRIAVMIGALLLATSAHAAVTVECGSSNPAVRIPGCTAMIDNPSTVAADRQTALAYRAEGYLNKRQPAEALTDLTAALKLNPKHAWALAVRGRYYIIANDHERALSDLNAALQVSPSLTYALWLRGVANTSAGQYPAAKVDLDKALDISPTYADALTARGRLSYLQHQYDSALDDLNAAIALSPNFTLPRKYRADLFVQKKRFEEAIADYDRILTIAPDNTDARNSRNAAAALASALKPGTVLPPAPPSAGTPSTSPAAGAPPLLTQAQQALQRGDYAGTIRLADQLLKATPDQPAALLLLGRAHWAINDLPTARGDFDRYVKASPDDLQAYIYRSLLLANIGDEAAAMADVVETERRAPNDTRGPNLRGLIQTKFEHHDAALEAFASAIALAAKPDAVKIVTADAVYVNRALTHLGAKNYPAAEADLALGYGINAKNARVFAVRGQLYARLGKPDLAERDFRDALTLNPQDSQSRVGQQALFAARAARSLPETVASQK